MRRIDIKNITLFLTEEPTSMAFQRSSELELRKIKNTFFDVSILMITINNMYRNSQQLQQPMEQDQVLELRTKLF
jgi:hypothetical protein